MREEMLSVIRGETVEIERFYNALPQTTKEHSESVAQIAGELLGWAAHAGMCAADSPDAKVLRRCARYHDIGIALIPERLLCKSEISAAEYRVVQRHALYGGSLLDSYRQSHTFPRAEDAFWGLCAEVALSHHERWDGQGYPYGQRTTAVPLAARITAVADAYDAMVRGTLYRIALPPEYAMLEIVQNRGKQFDPDLADLFKAHCDEIIEKYRSVSCKEER